MFAWQRDDRFSLVLGANRDEFRARPTARAAWWHVRPEILAGRDLSALGTWLGLKRDGHFAALTNIRNGAAAPGAPRSRGELVVKALDGDSVTDKSAYAGYNLIYGEPARGLMWIDGNRPGQSPTALTPGIYGLSNGRLDDAWPKVIRAKQGLDALLADSMPHEALTAAILDLLESRAVFADAALPDTGIGLDRERALSPLFIDLGEYGTRCSSVVLIEHSGKVHFTERSFDGAAPSDVSYEFELAGAAV